jgi:glycosyltransferase involved in cell wall biosynthesis
MPLSIMEAMAKGVPVMATAVSGVPEELGPTGKLLPNPELNPEATVKEIVATIHLWAKDDKLRQQIGRQCKDRAEEHFRAERMVAEYLRAVDSALLSLSSAKTVTEALS